MNTLFANRILTTRKSFIRAMQQGHSGRRFPPYAGVCTAKGEKPGSKEHRVP